MQCCVCIREVEWPEHRGVTDPHEGAEDPSQDLGYNVEGPLGPGGVAGEAGGKGDCRVQVPSRHIGCDVHCNKKIARSHVNVCTRFCRK